MKRMKKLLAVLLAVVMVMTMGSMSVLAEELTASADSYSITVVSGKADRTYTAYQLFSGTLESANLTNIGGGSNLDIYTEGVEDQSKIDSLSGDLKSESTPISIIGYSTVGELVTDKLVNYTPSAIADFLTEYGAIDSNVLVGFANVSAKHLTGTGVSSISYTDNNDGTYSYKISGLEAGYYLIIETTTTVTGDSYSRYMLSMSGTEAANVTIKSKEVVPTLTKELVDETEKSSTSKTVGDIIKYQLSADVPDTTGYSSYTFKVTDTISKGLELDTDTIKVTIGTANLTNGKEVQSTEVADIENGITDMSSYSYYYYTTTDNNNNTILNIVFVNFLTLARTYYDADAKPAVAVTIDYSATLTSEAAVGSAGNSNTATLTYSNNPATTATSETTPDKVVVYTYELDFTKKDAMNGAVLSDAKFYLYRYASNGTAKEYAVVSQDTTDTTKYTITEWKEITDPLSELESISITSGTDGTFEILGLGTGTFYLCEYEAPSGYTEFNDKKIVIAAETDEPATGTFSITSLSATIDDDSANVINGNNTNGVFDGTISIVVTNSNSTAIPSTGGIGTTIFYIVGAILVLGAGVILITRRRMASR